MQGFGKAFKQMLLNKQRVNYRDRRAHYASDATKCLRDLYWKRTGVPATNPPDLVSKLKMLYGTAIGKEFALLFGSMFEQGYFLAGAEVPAGSSEPNINCYLDALMYEVNKNGEKEYFVVEVKTASGFGATLLAQSCEPKRDYLAQIGIYLKDMSAKGVTNRGCIFYALLSDKSIGELVQVNCYYDEDTDEVVAYEGSLVGSGEFRNLNNRLKVGEVQDRLVQLDKHLADKEVPKPEFVYKYPVTPEAVAEWSDNDLLKALRDGTVKGDWQVKYSDYKDLQLKTDGVSPGYSAEEIAVIKAEKRRRTPNSKYVK